MSTRVIFDRPRLIKVSTGWKCVGEQTFKRLLWSEEVRLVRRWGITPETAYNTWKTAYE